MFRARICGYSQGLLIAVIILASHGCGVNAGKNAGSSGTNGATLERVKKQKELKVAFINYPPMVYRDPEDPGSGKMKGLFVDLLQEIMREVDPQITIKYEETTWEDFTTLLTSRRADLSIAGTFATIPRAKVVSFTSPICYLGRGAVVRKDDNRFSTDLGPEQFDQPKLKIGVVSGEGSHEFVKSRFRRAEIVVFSGADLSQCLGAVSAGQVDVGLSDALETQKYVRAHKDVVDVYASAPYDLYPVAWAVRQDDLAWRDFLSTCLHTLEVSGRTAEFEAKYDFQWTHLMRTFGPRKSGSSR